MRAFALPLSISRRIYEVFEFLSCDHIPFSKTVGGVQRSFSIRGYTGIILFADRATGKIFNYLVKNKSEWLQCLKDCIAEYGPSTRNPKSVNLAYLQSDFATEVHSTEFAAFLKDKKIKPLNSTPYKHAQNLLERFAQSFKNMIRTSLSTNDCPIRYWCYAAQYAAQTYNKLYRKGSTVSRDEAFYGIKADVSNCVPFYEHGWAYVSADERASILRRGSTKALSDRGVQIRCLGYAEPYEIPNKSLAEAYIKNAYICLNLAENKIMPRHDCLWNTPTPGGLSNVLQNNFNTEDNVTSASEEYDYNLLFDGPPRDYSNWQGENISTTSILDDPDGIIDTSESPILEEENLESDDGSLGESDTESENTASLKNLRKKRGRTCDSKQPSPPLDTNKAKNHRKHLQRKAKKTEAREAYMRKANYAKIEESYGTRHPIVDPEQIKIDSTIEAILATHFPKNECQPDATSSSYEHAAKKSRFNTDLAAAHLASDYLLDDDDDEISAFNAEFEGDPESLIHHYNDATIPKDLREALEGPDGIHWLKAWQTEMHRLKLRQTWVDIQDEEEMGKCFSTSISPLSIKPMKSKYAFRVTVNVDGTLKHRCRLVGCGYSQILGQDYDDTFAPTAKYRSLCMLLHLAAIFDWDINGLDVEQAFLESDIDKEIYMTLPKNVYEDNVTKKPVIVRLRRSLYGLKQAGELWYAKIDRLFKAEGYKRLIHDQCIYIKRDNETGAVSIICCYVDDILFMGNCPTEISSTIKHFRSQVTNLTEMGEVKRYIGVDIKRDRVAHTISLSQQPYIDKIIKSNSIPEDSESVPIPMSDTVDYATLGDGSQPLIQDKVGQFRFLPDRTRPDIATAVGILGSAAAKPTRAHLRGVNHLAKYLKSTKELELVLGGLDDEVNLFGYTDASHNPDKTSRPRLGYCFYLNLESGTIFARSVKDTCVSHSSCESEIKAIDTAVRQVVWMRGFLEELGFPQKDPTILYTDSESAIKLSELCNVGNNSMHIVMRINYIHESIEAGIIRLKYVNTDNEVADVLTKLLPISAHQIHREFLMHGHHGKLPSGETSKKNDQRRNKRVLFKLNQFTGKYVHKHASKKLV